MVLAELESEMQRRVQEPGGKIHWVLRLDSLPLLFSKIQVRKNREANEKAKDYISYHTVYDFFHEIIPSFVSGKSIVLTVTGANGSTSSGNGFFSLFILTRVNSLNV